MNFVERGDIDEGLDGWLSMDSLLIDYRDVLSDRVLEYLEGFPKYYEDVKPKTVFN